MDVENTPTETQISQTDAMKKKRNAEMKKRKETVQAFFYHHGIICDDYS